MDTKWQRRDTLWLQKDTLWLQKDTSWLTAHSFPLLLSQTVFLLALDVPKPT